MGDVLGGRADDLPELTEAERARLPSRPTPHTHTSFDASGARLQTTCLCDTGRDHTTPRAVDGRRKR